jgi:hypothetical protein
VALLPQDAPKWNALCMSAQEGTTPAAPVRRARARVQIIIISTLARSGRINKWQTCFEQLNKQCVCFRDDRCVLLVAVLAPGEMGK